MVILLSIWTSDTLYFPPFVAQLLLAKLRCHTGTRKGKRCPKDPCRTLFVSVHVLQSSRKCKQKEGDICDVSEVQINSKEKKVVNGYAGI